ncbi:hypothetical protein AOLI_G00188150 [Acnodon oligacanthus]
MVLARHQKERESGNLSDPALRSNKDVLLKYADSFPEVAETITQRSTQADDSWVGFGAHRTCTYKQVYESADREKKSQADQEKKMDALKKYTNKRDMHQPVYGSSPSSSSILPPGSLPHPGLCPRNQAPKALEPADDELMACALEVDVPAAPSTPPAPLTQSWSPRKAAQEKCASCCSLGIHTLVQGTQLPTGHSEPDVQSLVQDGQEGAQHQWLVLRGHQVPGVPSVSEEGCRTSWSSWTLRIAPCFQPSSHTDRLSCDMKVVQLMRERSLGNSVSTLYHQLKEQQSEAWMTNTLQYVINSLSLAWRHSLWLHHYPWCLFPHRPCRTQNGDQEAGRSCSEDSSLGDQRGQRAQTCAPCVNAHITLALLNRRALRTCTQICRQSPEATPSHSPHWLDRRQGPPP